MRYGPSILVFTLKGHYEYFSFNIGPKKNIKTLKCLMSRVKEVKLFPSCLDSFRNILKFSEILLEVRKTFCLQIRFFEKKSTENLFQS